jgi:uncharacterized membrane protein
MKLRLPLVSFALVLALTPLAAPLLAAGHPLTALLIRNFYATVCHQNPGRSFLIEGSPAAVCVRCLGIYCGATLGLLPAVGKAPAVRLLGWAVLLNLLDVSSGMVHWHGNLPWTRFLLGLLLGAGVGAVLQPRENERGRLGIQRHFKVR